MGRSSPPPKGTTPTAACACSTGSCGSTPSTRAHKTACNTASGEGGGEALSGLARAFFYAGARSLFVAVHSDPEASPSERKVAALGLTMCLQDLGDLEAAALVDSLSTGEDPTLGRRLARALERREGIRR